MDLSAAAIEIEAVSASRLRSSRFMVWLELGRRDHHRPEILQVGTASLPIFGQSRRF
jgi:hypothetical protein